VTARSVAGTRRALADLERLDPAEADRVPSAVLALAQEWAGDAKKLAGRERLSRLRVGDLRVLFRLAPRDPVLEVIRGLPPDIAYRD
jgi:mRNA-degrading endonuclease RelE of RelBE toxin-antitoxin system